MTSKKPTVCYHAVVRERSTLRELARCSYTSQAEAAAAVRDLRQSYKEQGRTTVTVTLEK